MEKNKGTRDKECKPIRDLLTRRISEKLTEAENSQLQSHLASCQECRAFQDILLKMQDAVKIEDRPGLVPNPAIRENVLRRMRPQKHRRKITMHNFIKAAKRALEFRIPVYQAVLSALVIFVLAFALRHLSPTVGQHVNLSPAALPNESVVDGTPVLDNLNIIKQQKIGTNMQEDSVLTRFVVSAM
jgi:predicted anti-sigma-YlaC factor YlaD